MFVVFFFVFWRDLDQDLRDPNQAKPGPFLFDFLFFMGYHDL